MRCEACEDGRCHECGRQSWCDCDCEGMVEAGDIGPPECEAEPVEPSLHDEVERFRAAVRERVANPLLAKHRSVLFRRDSQP